MTAIEKNEHLLNDDRSMFWNKEGCIWPAAASFLDPGPTSYTPFFISMTLQAYDIVNCQTGSNYTDNK